jgi:hypothetical protein
LETYQKLRVPAMFPWDDSCVTVPGEQSLALRMSFVLTKSNSNNHQRERESRITARFIWHLLFVFCITH